MYVGGSSEAADQHDQKVCTAQTTDHNEYVQVSEGVNLAVTKFRTVPSVKTKVLSSDIVNVTAIVNYVETVLKAKRRSISNYWI